MTRRFKTRPFRKPLAATGAAVLVSLALSGCISFGPKVPEQLIRLAPDEVAPAGSTATGQIADALVVLDPEADRSIDVLRVPVAVDASSVSYLQDAVWIERPSRQFRSLLAETLRARTGRLVVEGGDFEVTGRTLVGGRILQMGYDVPTSSVVVRFDAMRTERGGPIQSKRFEGRVSGIEAKAETVGPALNRAANDVAKQVSDWVKG